MNSLSTARDHQESDNVVIRRWSKVQKNHSELSLKQIRTRVQNLQETPPRSRQVWPTLASDNNCKQLHHQVILISDISTPPLLTSSSPPASVLSLLLFNLLHLLCAALHPGTDPHVCPHATFCSPPPREKTPGVLYSFTLFTQIKSCSVSVTKPTKSLRLFHVLSARRPSLSPGHWPGPRIQWTQGRIEADWRNAPQ